MEWDLAVFPQPVSKALAFNQLLDNLRSLHEEICARNAELELQVEHFHDHSAANGKKDDLLMPREGLHRWPRSASCGPLTPGLPAPRGQCNSAQSSLRGPRTPRILSTFVPDIQELKASIHTLAMHQDKFHEHLNEQLAQISASCRNPSRPSNLSNGRHTRFSMRNIDAKVEPESARASVGSGSADSVQEEEATDQQSTVHSRFAVPSGVTRELNVGETKTWSLRHTVLFESLINSWRPLLRRFLNGSIFSAFSSLLIFSYAGLIGAETNMIAQDPEGNPSLIKTLHYVYSGVFCLELLLRFAAFGCEAFTGAEGFWNKLDLCFVVFALIEICMESAAGSESAASTVVRPVRILRVVRSVRLVRAFRQFHEFQKMAYALLSSMKTLACSLAILIFVMFFFAVWLTQSAADAEARQRIQDLELRYGGLMSTAYTLFLSVSNGISWDYAYMPLHHLNWWSAQGLVMYISITLFGVLNVVTSIFVESVMRSMQHSRDLIVQEKEEEKTIAIQHVKEVFRHLDINGNGQVSTQELEHFLQEPSLRCYMEALDIEAEDTRLLFRLLDRDGSGVISSDEFCEGCLRLKGSARSIDVHALIFQIKAFLDKWCEFTDYVDNSFAKLHQRLPKASEINHGSRNHHKSTNSEVKAIGSKINPNAKMEQHISAEAKSTCAEIRCSDKREEAKSTCVEIGCSEKREELSDAEVKALLR